MAKYKSQNDIPYLKFMEYAKVIQDRTDDLEFVAEKVIEFFYPEETEHYALRVEEFSNALNVTSRAFFPYKIDLKQLGKADNFIDADSFANDKDFESLLRKIVKPLIPFTKVDFQKISLSDGNKIMQSFLHELPKLSSPFNTYTIRQLGLQLTR